MTPAVTALSVLGTLVLAGLLLFAIEIKTLRDDIPSNHITESLRIATREHPGLVVLLMFAAGWLTGVVSGHVWSQW